MSNALIITDNLDTTSAVKEGFSAIGWHAHHLDLMNFLSHDNQDVAMQYQCALLFVDKVFVEKYSNLIDDVSETIKSCAANMPIYLSFEENYDNRFYWWRLRSKRIFECVGDTAAIQEIIREITKLETSMQNLRAYVSPMS
jgi:hypothetical protein